MNDNNGFDPRDWEFPTDSNDGVQANEVEEASSTEDTPPVETQASEPKDEAISYSYGRDHDYGRSFDQKTAPPAGHTAYTSPSYCKRCGSRWESGATYCKTCGYAIQNTYANPNSTSTGYQPYNPSGSGAANHQGYQYQTPGNPNSDWQTGYQYQQGKPVSGGYNQNLLSDVPEQPKSYRWDFNDYDKMDPAPGNKRRRKKGPVIALVLVFVLMLGSVAYLTHIITRDSILAPSPDTSSSEVSTLPRDGSEPASSSGLNIVDIPSAGNEEIVAGQLLTTKQIHQKVAPSVVGIQTYTANNLSNAIDSEGSGIIMTADGLIVTNQHVIEGAVAIKVILADGESYEATLVGADSKTDLALIKISATGLTAAEFGNSAMLEVGDKVVAIGNPGGLAFAGSTTEGIISGLNREITELYAYDMTCIQTDAAINPGNSGGALANEYGQVVGITSAKISGSGYEGMGFAIPIHEAEPILAELQVNGRVTGRPAIGIDYVPGEIVDEIASRIYGVPTGIIVRGVREDSDAYAKGLQVGDIIHMVDDVVIKDITDIQYALSLHTAGDTVTLNIFRRDLLDDDWSKGETIILEVVLMESVS